LDRTYVDAAKDLGRELAAKDIGLIYGGGKVGVMGEIANAVFEAGGEVIGVIPKDLVSKEIANFDITDLLVVPSMHDRKALMIEMADAFIALPGGFGTLEEFFEAVTWAQLGIHSKPCGLLNIDGYYDKLMQFLDHSVEAQFIHRTHRSLVLVEQDLGTLLRKFKEHKPPKIDKAGWVMSLSEGSKKA
jgi:hypothetical protein